MPRLTGPLFSFLARKTIGRALTYRAGKSGPQAIKPPTHPDSHTLAQRYHRWDYSDYCAWWSQLTTPQRAPWVTAARGKPTTPMSEFLRHYMHTRADQVATYHLDELIAGQALDDGPNNLHLTNAGTTEAPGLYGGSLYAANIGDHLQSALSPAFDVDYVSCELWIHLTVSGANHILLYKATGVAPWEAYRIGLLPNDVPHFRVALAPAGAGSITANAPGPLTLNHWHHVTGTYDGAVAICYLDGQPGQPGALAGTLWKHTDTLYLCALPGFDTGYRIDETRIVNRALSQPEILKRYRRS